MNLLYRGKGRKIKNLNVLWEEIIRRNNEENGDFNFNNYFNTLKTYADLLNEYILVKACLLDLSIKVKADVVETLRELGYIIELSSIEEYKRTLQIVNAQSNNLVTKIITKRKELEAFHKNKGKPVTFAQAMIGISAGLGYQVQRDITLAEYNEAKKLIKQRHGRNNKSGRNTSSK